MNAAADWVLGVDFGVVNTAAALRDPSGRVTELPLSSTRMVMPSAVFCSDQQIVVGQSAIHAGLTDPVPFEPYPKRRLATHSSKWPSEPTKPDVYVPSLVTAVLAEVLSRAREVTGGEIPQQLVLTHPDGHGGSLSESSQLRDGLQEAADLLVCRHCQLVPDSMAVARFVESDAQLVSPAIVVLDFGAVKSDAVVCIRQYDGSYAAVASRSVTQLGGLALEARVRHWVCDSLDAWSPDLRASLDEPLPGNTLRVHLPIREAIEALSVDASADIVIDGAPDPAVLRLTRDQFDVLTRGYLDAAVDLTREMLAVAEQLKKSSAGTVIVTVGAAARNPTLRRRLSELAFVADFGDPRTIIARGAAYHRPLSRARPTVSSDGSATLHGGGRQPDSGRRTQPAAKKASVLSLVAEVTRDGRPCTRALAPRCEHELQVRIAPARRGKETLAADEGATPNGDRAVKLLVDVASEDGSVQETATVMSPTRDPILIKPTTSVKFTTGDDGSTVRLTITVLQNGKPVQAALLVASVRSRPSWRDHVRVFQVPLSAAAQPRTDTATADVALECTASALKRLGTSDAVEIPLLAVTAITDVMQEAASKVLSAKDAPQRLDEPAALRLLINLARLGSRLADTLADLGLTDARTIAIKVRGDLPIVPLELAYDGVAPDSSAVLCDCLLQPKTPSGTATSHASAHTVCPHAFWGMSRMIVRLVESEPVKRLASPTHPRPLSLRPVLYGAADDADETIPPWELPADKLERTLIARAANQYTRVSSWRAWRRAARRVAPELLVMLADTEMRTGTPTLIIGSQSRLGRGRLLPGHRAVEAPAPLALLCVRRSDVFGDVLGVLPGKFIDHGAAALVTTLTSVGPAQAAAAAAALVNAMHTDRLPTPTVSAAVAAARRQLIAESSPAGLLLATYGDTDLPLRSYTV